MNRTGIHLVFAACLCAGLSVADLGSAEASAAIAESQTPANVRRAHDAAQKGVTMFTRFAVKADEEGYRGAASLFRAAARSQQVHAALFEKAITAASGKTETFDTPVIPEVKTTKENLAAAIEWINTQRGEVLVKAIATARTEGEKNSESTLNYMRQALTEVGRLARTLQGDLESSRGSTKAHFVDRTCGYVVDKLDFQKCPVCFATRDNFERVE